MEKKISSALISVYYKDGLEPLLHELNRQGIILYSTGGTQKFIEETGYEVIPVEDLTSFPSILGGRVKTLHPNVFGGILGRRNNATDVQEMKTFEIPVIDLVIVDLYPFQETVSSTNDESKIIEKIDIGGPSMIRAAAKNFNDVAVIASKKDYEVLAQLLKSQNGALTLEQRKVFAAKAFRIVYEYDLAINDYFNKSSAENTEAKEEYILRYGENPHQKATFHGNLNECFDQLNGKELSYNNLVDVDAAVELIKEFNDDEIVFAIIKHTNVCGIASRNSVHESWAKALAGDPESAFGGILICNHEIDMVTAEAINELFFEVLIAPSFSNAALEKLKSKKNRIVLQLKKFPKKESLNKTILNGILEQDKDKGNFDKWEEVGGRTSTENEKANLKFANLICKHLKSNAIAIVKDKQLIGKGCGQTSRIDALRQAIEKARMFNFDLNSSVMASDAFFPFNDCVQLANEAGIKVYIQPGGSKRDNDSIEYCKEHGLVMVLTGQRHFRH